MDEFVQYSLQTGRVKMCLPVYGMLYSFKVSKDLNVNLRIFCVIKQTGNVGIKKTFCFLKSKRFTFVQALWKHLWLVFLCVTLVLLEVFFCVFRWWYCYCHLAIAIFNCLICNFCLSGDDFWAQSLTDMFWRLFIYDRWWFDKAECWS